MKGHLGDRFWGQVRGLSGRPKACQGRDRLAAELVNLRAKALYERESAARCRESKSSMVRRGSPVRVRKRASANSLYNPIFSRLWLSSAQTVGTSGHLRVMRAFAQCSHGRRAFGLSGGFRGHVTPSLKIGRDLPQRVATHGKRPAYHGTSQATGGDPRQRFSLALVVSTLSDLPLIATRCARWAP
jgi:hypothetical protein